MKIKFDKEKLNYLKINQKVFLYKINLSNSKYSNQEFQLVKYIHIHIYISNICNNTISSTRIHYQDLLSCIKCKS